ncbi:MAG: TonB-dependent receptor [Candidatus Zixiibacteriota bacterium]
MPVGGGGGRRPNTAPGRSSQAAPFSEKILLRLDPDNTGGCKRALRVAGDCGVWHIASAPASAAGSFPEFVSQQDQSFSGLPAGGESATCAGAMWKGRMNVKNSRHANFIERLRAFLLIPLATLAVQATLTAPAAAASPDWEISVKVIDQEGRAIIAASVLTDKYGAGGVTGDNGESTLSGDGQPPSRVTISHVGYQPSLWDLKGGDFGQTLTIVMQAAVIPKQGIIVRSSRARSGETPVAFSDITAEQIERDYTVGDLPVVLQSAPNVYVYADAGSHLGYNHISIRGFDEKRISTYINGVPLNDPEDHVTYFVDLPDFASNVRDIQIQRGVGSSLYADGTFGGSINVVSYALDQPRRFSFSTGLGAYNHEGDLIGETSRQNLEFSSGLIDGRYHILTRFSRQSSGGYVENSWSNGWAYFISASRLDPKSTTTFNTYGGPIRTHAAWDGIDLDTYRVNRRANSLTYFNEGDNFNQPHYELHNKYELNERSILHTTLFYIRGKGFFDQFKTGRSPAEFNVDPSLLADPVADVDVVVQQWVKKSQVGLNSRIDIDHKRGQHSLGVSGYFFESEHWGQVNASTNVISGFTPGRRYYEYFGEKLSLSVFADERYRLAHRLNAQLSLQLRHLRYSFDQTRIGAFVANPEYDFDLNWTFLSPRVGLNYTFDATSSVFGSFSISDRTPRDQDIYDANDPTEAPDFGVKPERLYDYELGYQFRSSNFSAGINLFYMWFNNEVIFFGVDDDGSRLTDNAENSYHSGIELSAAVRPAERLKFDANFSYNRNRYDRYVTNLAVFDPSFNPAGVAQKNFAGNVIPGFPELIGNLAVDYQSDRYRITYRFRGVGRQYVESSNDDSLSIAGFGISSLGASWKLAEDGRFGRVSLSVSVENMFDKLYLQSGYGGNYLIDSNLNDIVSWGNYYASAGRSFFARLKLSLN